MSQLQNIIKNLELNNDVDAVFLTGSYGADKKNYSDIDLIVILTENHKQIESIFTWIDDTFADIYFFDLTNVKSIMASESLFENSMNSRLYRWIKKGVIQFDKSGNLTKLKSMQIDIKVNTNGVMGKEWYWHHINYNFEANSRYFKSGNSTYHEALEMKLLYSVSQLITGYFSFRDIPWDGEKSAINYLSRNDLEFYEKFMAYSRSADLAGKFNFYRQMVKLVFVEPYRLWSRNEILPKKIINPNLKIEPELIEYWKKLIS